MFFPKFLTLVVAVIAIPSQASFYKNHKVVEVPNTPPVAFLLKELNADIWSQNPNSIDVRLTPNQYQQFQSLFPLLNFKVKVDDVQSVIDSANELATGNSGDWFGSYHSYNQILDWYKNHAKQNPSAVKLNPSIGKTHLGKDIFAVHLTNSKNNGSSKKQIWFQSLTHAREWIGGTTTQYVFNHLLTNRESDPIIKNILDNVEIVFIPIVNPDGYEFSRNGHRLWRKNFSTLSNGTIVGVDINRNFPYNWGGPGASTNPLADDYRGPSSASEPETQALIKYYNSFSNMIGAIDWHSYSELILRPYGHTKDYAPDEEKLKELGDQLVKEIKSVRGKSYTNQREIDLYAASGTAEDFFYGDGGKTYAYTIELSPNSNDPSIPGTGFILPPSEIKPVGKDLIPAAIRFLDEVSKHPLKG